MIEHVQLARILGRTVDDEVLAGFQGAPLLRLCSIAFATAVALAAIVLGVLAR